MGIGKEMMEKYPGGRWVTIRGGNKVYIKKDGEPAPETPIEKEAKNTDEMYKDEKGNYIEKRKKEVHEPIINKILEQAGESEKYPTIILTGGGSASGKSSIRNEYVEDLKKYGNRSAGIIDSDDIKSDIPEYEQFQKEDPDGAAMRVHDESSDISKEAIDACFREKKNFVFDGTMKNYDKYAKLIKRAKKEGYQVVILGADCSLEEAKRRNQDRYEKTGRYVPDEIVEGSHTKFPQVFEKLCDMADDYWLYSTEGDKKLVNSKATGAADPDKYSQFLNKGGMGDKKMTKGVLSHA